MLTNDILFVSRNGLPRLLEILSQKICKIAFLGNSVTAQRNGYRSYLSDLITNEFKPQHHFINAGIGGVGSFASAFFVDDFVLRHKPDICFVECTVADIEGATPTHYITDSIHGIIKKLQSQKIVICFLYLFNSSKSTKKCNQVISLYENVLSQYGIPSINIYQTFSNNVNFGKTTINDLFIDGVHTTDLGARLTAKYIFNGIKNICQLKTEENIWTDVIDQPHFKLEFTKIIKPEEWVIQSSKNISRNKFKGVISYIELKNSEFISFKVAEGAFCGILLVVDQYSGVISIQHNSNDILVQTFDNWCDKERLQVVILEQPIKYNTTITISLSEFDRADRGANIFPNIQVKKGTSTKIVGFLNSLDNRPDKINLLW